MEQQNMDIPTVPLMLQESRILGLREMHEGSASTQLDTLKEVLADIAAMGNAKSDNSNNSVDRIVASIKNVMSDRFNVQKNSMKFLLSISVSDQR